MLSQFLLAWAEFLFRGIWDDKTLTNAMLLFLVILMISVQGYEVSDTINPCDNYMGYVCEEFNKMAVSLPNIKSEAGYRSAIFFWDCRTAALEMTTDPKYEILETFFKSCMDRASRNKFGIENFMKMFEVYKGWPVLEECCAKDKTYGPWELTDLIVESYMIGEANVMSVRNRKFNGTDIIELKPILTGRLDRYTSKRMEEHHHYEEFLKEVIDLFGGNGESPDVQEIINLEQHFVKLKKQWRPEVTKVMKLSQFRETLGEGSFDIEAILKGIFKEVPDIEITGESNLMIEDPQYFVEVNKIFSNAPIRNVANYMIWRNIIQHYPALPDKFHRMESLRRMSRYLMSKPTQPSCLNKIVEYTFFKIYRDHVIRNYPKESQTDFEALFKLMVSTIGTSARNCFMDGLHELEKLKTMAMVSGLRDSYDDSHTLFQNIYKKELQRTNYLDNVINMDKQLRLFKLSNYKIGGQPMKDIQLFEAMKRRQILYNDEENIFYLPINMFNTTETLDEDMRPIFYGEVGTAMAFAILKVLSYNKYVQEQRILECRSKQLNLFASENENFLYDVFLGRALDMAVQAHKNYLRNVNKRVREQGALFIGFARARCSKSPAVKNDTTRILINMYEFSSIYRCKTRERLFMKQARCIRDC